MNNASSNSILEQLKKAKAYSDAKQYEQKHLLMHELIKKHKNEFTIDSDDGSDIVGVTHSPTGFQMHLPKEVIADLNINNTSAYKASSILSLCMRKSAVGSGITYTPRQTEIMQQYPNMFPAGRMYSPNAGYSGLQNHIGDLATGAQQGSLLNSNQTVVNDALVNDSIQQSINHTFPSDQANALAEFYGHPKLFQPRSHNDVQKPFVSVTTNTSVNNDSYQGAKMTQWRPMDSMPATSSMSPSSGVARFATWAPSEGADTSVNKTSAVGLNVGEGLPQTATQRMPSQFGMLKTKLKKDTMSKDNAPVTPFAQMFPETQKFRDKKTRINAGMINKRAAFAADAARYLGYRPGVWYDEKDDVAYANRMRFGNMVSGVGLAGLGLASVPILKYLFPERFAEKGTALNIAAVAGGLLAPWAINAPHTFSEINKFTNTSNAEYTPQARQALQTAISKRTPSIASYPGAVKAGAEKQSFVSLGTPIPKMHLADVASEQLQSGYIDYGQAAGLMMAANRASSKPWFTVGDLARTAIGAGAGAIAGTAAAKGIGMFMNLKPTEQKIMQGTGAALGALINLGKLTI
jgi:hypothetical protein